MNSLRFLSITLVILISIAAFSSCNDTIHGTDPDTDTKNNDGDTVFHTDTEENTESESIMNTESDTEDLQPQLKRSPIAYFSFDKLADDGSFIEDISGEKCVSVGSPQHYNAGKFKKSLYLDGNSHISFRSDNLKLPTGNSDHTVTSWIKIHKAMPSSSDGVVAGWGQYQQSSDTRLLIYRNQFCASSYGIHTAYPVSNSYKAEWLHFAMTYSDNTYRMYLNGTIVGVVKGNGTDIKDTELFIGGFGAAGLNFMGAIDEICIYDAALTNEEIVENMNGNIDYKSSEEMNENILFEGADTPMGTGWNSMMYMCKTGYINFKLYLPKNYDPNSKYPIIMFMPGDGAIGKSIDEVIGGNESVYMNRCIMEGEDCICIVPAMTEKWLKVPNDTNTVYPYKDYSMSDAVPSYSFNTVRNLLAECVDTLAVDKDRVYFIGYSRGTMAGFYWLADDPDLFAGALLCCGAGDPNTASKYKDVPVWMFIGDADNLVSVERFKAIYDAYTTAGGEGNFTAFSGGTHSLKPHLVSADGIVEWLLSQNRSK